MPKHFWEQITIHEREILTSQAGVVALLNDEIEFAHPGPNWYGVTPRGGLRKES